MNGESTMSNAITLYSTSQVDKKIEVFFQDENFWLTQKLMAELFGVEVNTVNYHIKEISKNQGVDRRISYSKN